MGIGWYIVCPPWFAFKGKGSYEKNDRNLKLHFSMFIFDSARIVCGAGSMKRSSVRPSVRLSHRSIVSKRPAAGLLLNARGKDISVDSCRRSTETASVVLARRLQNGVEEQKMRAMPCWHFWHWHNRRTSCRRLNTHLSSYCDDSRQCLRSRSIGCWRKLTTQSRDLESYLLTILSWHPTYKLKFTHLISI